MIVAESDMTLLRRFREDRDAGAFAEIVRRYAGAVFATCQRILRDSSSAEDAAQETFYRLMTRPQHVTASVGGWLHRAATRLALDIRRSDLARRRRESVYQAPAPVEASTWAELMPHLDEALAALDDQERELLVRHFLRGEAQADLATEARTSAATMSRRIRSAVDCLRQQLVQRGISLTPGILLGLLSRNGISAASAGLQAALGKMSLYCTASSPGAATTGPVSVVRATARMVYGLRWAVVAAGVSIGMAFLAALLVQRLAAAIDTSRAPSSPEAQAADIRMLPGDQP